MKLMLIVRCLQNPSGAVPMCVVALSQDIRRLLILGYPGPSSTAHDAIAKDSFIDALPVELGLKVREHDPLTLDAALHVALRLEAIHQATAAREAAEDNARTRGRVRAVVSDNNSATNNAILSRLNELASRFDTQLKSVSGRMDNLEHTLRRQPSVNDTACVVCWPKHNAQNMVDCGPVDI